MVSSDPIVDAWSELVARAPLQIALASPGTADRSATTAQIETAAARLEQRLADLSGGGRTIAISVPNGPLFFAAFLAVRRLGHVAMTLDAGAPKGERQRVAARLGAHAVVSSDSGWRSANEANLERLESAAGQAPPPPPSGTALIKLTSGSTGEVQGIAVSAENLIADDRNLTSTMKVSPEDRILAAIPLSHSYGFSSVALPCLLRGNPLIVPREGLPLGALAAARRADATFLPTVPSFIDALLRMSSPPPLPPSLRLLITAGAPLSSETAQRFGERYEHPVQPFYGASECGGIAFDRDGSAGITGALGPPVDGVEVRLLPEDSAPETAARDVGDAAGRRTGVVEVVSEAVALQYYPTPMASLDAGRFRTSDRACFDERGALHLLGRVDAVVNVRGLKVHPGEVEATLTQMPGIREAAVLGVSGPHGTTLRAVVGLDPGPPSEAEIRRWCLHRLPRHKVPRRFVRVDRLPRTERGKLDRRALLALVGAPPTDDTEERG